MQPVLDVFEAIQSARMLRVLKPDPVPDALIQRVLEAAICAPSAGNAQPRTSPGRCAHSAAARVALSVTSTSAP